MHSDRTAAAVAPLALRNQPTASLSDGAPRARAARAVAAHRTRREKHAGGSTRLKGLRPLAAPPSTCRAAAAATYFRGAPKPRFLGYPHHICRLRRR